MTDAGVPLPSEQLLALMHERDPHTIHARLGIRVEKVGKDECVVAVDVGEHLFQHGGVVHGGVYVLLMESAASMLCAFSVDITKNRVAGQEVSASHVRSATTGTITARARPLHVGKSAIVCACDVDNDGRLVSTGRLTIAIRPL